MANDQDGDQKEKQRCLVKVPESVLFLQFIKQGDKSKPSQKGEVVTEKHAPRKAIQYGGNQPVRDLSEKYRSIFSGYCSLF